MLFRSVVHVLLGLLVVVILAATLDLGIILFKDLTNPPYGMLEMRELLETLGLFLLVLIAIEMVYVVRLYLEERHFDVEIVLMVALIAIARKVIVFDLEKYDAGLMFSIAAIVLALACALYLLRRSRHRLPSPPGAGPGG